MSLPKVDRRRWKISVEHGDRIDALIIQRLESKTESQIAKLEKVSVETVKRRRKRILGQ